jgi:hypothetical protein
LTRDKREPMHRLLAHGKRRGTINHVRLEDEASASSSLVKRVLGEHPVMAPQ